ncbi:hypothetical protein PMAYCL1PPCAC_17318, partial [Pristionchus mayeri]
RKMTFIMNVLDCTLGTIGIPMNLILTIAIIFAKGTHLKAYSLILFHSAVTVLTEVIVELLAMTRMMAEFPYLVYIFEGFCTHIGTAVCQISMQLELHLMFHSILLIAVSFWYRNVVLTGIYPSFVKTQSVILAILLPTILSTYILTWSNDSVNILPHFYPDINLSDVIHVGANFNNHHNKIVGVWTINAPMVAYGFIFYFRRQVHRTRKMHSSLLRVSHCSFPRQKKAQALSYHALLPSLSILGIFAFLAQNLGVQHPAIERVAYMSCSIPPAINPVLTLYFVGPYRR